VSGCGNPDFEGARAYEFLEAQCEIGPRPPGTEEHEETLAWLVGTLTPLADAVSVQRFTAWADTHEVALTNVIASFEVQERERVLLGAHWDTRAVADRDPSETNRSAPILGANDGASGVAVLLELATIMAARPPRVGVDIVLFDGEDGGDGGGLADWCLGSQYYAAHMGEYAPSYAIVVDMIGDAELSVRREPNSLASSRLVVDRVWEAARRVGASSFTDELWPPVYDDHVPLIRAGVPAIVIIDFDYPHWHTLEDTPDKCSAVSLAEVGRVLVDLVY
jgi:Zn-dependent M28 family amino/carboxypeptidase